MPSKSEVSVNCDIATYRDFVLFVKLPASCHTLRRVTVKLCMRRGEISDLIKGFHVTLMSPFHVISMV